ncbi:hypothetical protein CLOP_g4974 [Closterium sp. NIES-67]|nr:hypothetical protein CLOP_g4974 [Closterium sp. NIES-67]
MLANTSSSGSAGRSSATALRVTGARSEERFLTVALPCDGWARGGYSRARLTFEARSTREPSSRTAKAGLAEETDDLSLSRRLSNEDAIDGFDEGDDEDWLEKDATDGDDAWLEEAAGRIDKSSTSNAYGSSISSSLSSVEGGGGLSPGGEGGSSPAGPLGGKLGNAERKELRAYAHRMGNRISTHQIGKWGVTSTVITSLHDGLEKHELLKIKISDNCPDEAWEVGQVLEEKLAAQVVGLIGRTALLYRPSLTKLAREDAMAKKDREREARRRRGMGGGRERGGGRRETRGMRGDRQDEQRGAGRGMNAANAGERQRQGGSRKRGK